MKKLLISSRPEIDRSTIREKFSGSSHQLESTNSKHFHFQRSSPEVLTNSRREIVLIPNSRESLRKFSPTRVDEFSRRAIPENLSEKSPEVITGELGATEHGVSCQLGVTFQTHQGSWNVTPTSRDILARASSRELPENLSGIRVDEFLVLTVGKNFLRSRQKSSRENSSFSRSGRTFFAVVRNRHGRIPRSHGREELFK